MTEDDGTQPFGDHDDGGSGFVERADWDTPEWRAEMAEKYGGDT